MISTQNLQKAATVGGFGTFQDKKFATKYVLIASLFQVMNCIRADNSLVIHCVIELIPHGDRVQCKRVGAQTSPISEMGCVPRCHILNGFIELFYADKHNCRTYSIENWI